MENTGVPFIDMFDSIEQSVYELYNVLFDDNDYKEMLLGKLDEILRYIAKLNVDLIATKTYIIANKDGDKVSDKIF